MSSALDPQAPNTGPSAELDSAALREQLAETREEIARADGKASILLAGAGVAVSAILAGLIAGDVKPSGVPGLVAALAGLACAATLAGLGLIAAALYLRCGSPACICARYVAEAASYPTPKALEVALLEDAHAGDRLLHQLFGLSKSVARKYSLLRWGMRLIGAAVVLGLAASVLNGVPG